MDLARLKAELERDEGRVLKPYEDSVGKITIGVGHNVSDVGISDAVADLLLEEDIEVILRALDTELPWWRSMDEERQRVLANLAFNVGVEGHTPNGKLLTFKNTLAYMQAGEYERAADNMLLSKWAGQVGPRAKRLASRMRAGTVAPSGPGA